MIPAAMKSSLSRAGRMWKAVGVVCVFVCVCNYYGRVQQKQKMAIKGNKGQRTPKYLQLHWVLLALEYGLSSRNRHRIASSLQGAGRVGRGTHCDAGWV